MNGEPPDTATSDQDTDSASWPFHTTAGWKIRAYASNPPGKIEWTVPEKG